MAKLSTDDLLEAFKEMTLLELSEFVKMFEETFDVTAAAPVAVAAVAAAGGGDAGAAGGDQDEFDVILEAAGDNKIPVRRFQRMQLKPLRLSSKALAQRSPLSNSFTLQGVGLRVGPFFVLCQSFVCHSICNFRSVFCTDFFHCVM